MGRADYDLNHLPFIRRNKWWIDYNKFKNDENYDIAIAMSSSRADSVLGHCPGWGYLNIYIRVPALAEGI